MNFENAISPICLGAYHAGKATIAEDTLEADMQSRFPCCGWRVMSGIDYTNLDAMFSFEANEMEFMNSEKKG